MATVTCACGRGFGPDDLVCGGCGRPRPKTGAPRHRAEPSGSTLPQPQSVPAPAQAQPDGVPAAQACDHRAARPGATNCPSCGAVLDTGAWTIKFPWGAHRIAPGEKLVIGREVGPYVTELDVDEFDTVSRRHAEIRCTQRGQLHLVDEHSTNGTFRNGTRLEPARPVELTAGDQVSFSGSCRVVIQEG